MTDKHASKGTKLQTQPKNRLWTGPELARLHSFTAKPAASQDLVRAFPGRSLRAIKSRLSALRAAMGKPLQFRQGGDDAINDSYETKRRMRCREMNDKYLAALRRAGYAVQVAA
jgi:hypothetical protein